MELEEAIKKLKNPKNIDLITLIRQFKREGIENFVVTRPDIIETILNHLTKQEKMIGLMADMITELKPAHFKKEKGGELAGEYRCLKKKEWKQYFEKKIEESE